MRFAQAVVERERGTLVRRLIRQFRKPVFVSCMFAAWAAVFYWQIEPRPDHAYKDPTARQTALSSPNDFSWCRVVGVSDSGNRVYVSSYNPECAAGANGPVRYSIWDMVEGRNVTPLTW